MNHGAALLITRSLASGGSERQLVALAGGLRARGRDVAVMTLYDGGALAPDLERSAVTRLSLGKRGRWDIVGPAARFASTLRRLRPAVVYGFLPTGQMLATVGGALAGSRVVWGVRSTALDWSRYDRMTRMSYRAARFLSGTADAIIVNSAAGAAGYVVSPSVGARMHVIPNGIDLTLFRRDPAGRRQLREEWQAGDETPVIGIVARLDPMKDHPTFLRAAARVLAQFPAAKFVVAGEGPPSYRAQLVATAVSLGLDGHILWLGDRNDLAAVYSALDVHCSSSGFGEGFSNAIAEAMACEVPCAATDCGDSAQIIGETGHVVPPGDDAALASALRALVAADRKRLGNMARNRIGSRFSVDTMVEQTAAVLWA
jgi:glycosyltransferase involved in cell wall biosynthesis